MKKGRLTPTLIHMPKLCLLILALLVGYRAGSLASGLAGGLALAAAALGSAGLQSGTAQSLNVFHMGISPSEITGLAAP